MGEYHLDFARSKRVDTLHQTTVEGQVDVDKALECQYHVTLWELVGLFYGNTYLA